MKNGEKLHNTEANKNTYLNNNFKTKEYYNLLYRFISPQLGMHLLENYFQTVSSYINSDKNCSYVKFFVTVLLMK